MKPKYIYATNLLGKTIRCEISFSKRSNLVTLDIQERKFFRWKNQGVHSRMDYLDSGDSAHLNACKIRKKANDLFERYEDRLQDELNFKAIFSSI